MSRVSACFTSWLRLHAASTERNGSYPITFIPSSIAVFATCAPIAPSPITPRVFPFTSWPIKFFLPFSASVAISAPLPASVSTHLFAAITGRLAIRSERITSSFTAFEFAPGVLNTTIPFCERSFTGMLFTPAPALAIAFTLGSSSIESISCERTRIASGLTISLAIS